ncbi:MAG: NAD(P)-binding domain-containing protein [Microbacterium enclense]
MRVIGIIGLGEAGSLYARGAVDAGYEVRGFDPAPTPTPEGVQRAGSLGDLVAASDLVIVLTGAALSARIATDAAPHLRAGAVYADFTTASPKVMVEVAGLIEGADARFADVAILGPVPAKGAATETIVSGTAATDVADVLRRLGADVELIDGPAGAATSRKLLRSVLMKSLAAVVIEALEAGRAAGCESWVRAQIAAQLSGDAEAKMDRYETGSRKHAVRRAHEMESVVDYLGSLGVASEMSDAARHVLERLGADKG